MSGDQLLGLPSKFQGKNRDIVERLHRGEKCFAEAEAEIKTLRAENESLRAWVSDDSDNDNVALRARIAELEASIPDEREDAARAALTEFITKLGCGNSTALVPLIAKQFRSKQ